MVLGRYLGGYPGCEFRCAAPSAQGRAPAATGKAALPFQGGSGAEAVLFNDGEPLTHWKACEKAMRAVLHDPELLPHKVCLEARVSHPFHDAVGGIKDIA
jgi:hypothetical protein